jgi:hypothetical protein
MASESNKHLDKNVSQNQLRLYLDVYDRIFQFMEYDLKFSTLFQRTPTSSTSFPRAWM